jgi:D-alanine-D-alanine ligase
VAFEYDSVALVERRIEGREFTLSILGREALPIIELKTPHEFYDFDAKYLADTTEYLCPCDLSAPQAEKCMRLGLTAFDALNAHGWARLDFMLDDEGQPWFIELNTVPGLTDHSLVPMAAATRGISFESLIARILATSFEPADR